jgi:hypothetical protein
VELFPLVLDDVEATDTYIGVSVGFAVGFAMVFGLESIIEWIVGSEEDDKKSDIGNENPNAKATEIRSPLLNDGDYINSKSGNSSERSSKDSGSGKMTNFVKTKVDADITEVTKGRSRRRSDEDGDWDDNSMHTSTRAMKLPQHRGHIVEHLEEIKHSIAEMEEKCTKLSSPDLNRHEMETLSEQIDEATHSLQYKLDHTRRY